MATILSAAFPAHLTGAKIALFVDYGFEDLVRRSHVSYLWLRSNPHVLNFRSDH
jgi:hypothetical protein